MKFPHTSILALASIMAARMLGLFMILPVFSTQALQFSGATPVLVGMALGIYGLTQGCLQIPFGLLSDHWGRKPVITLGLLLFGLGSVMAALSTSITGIIIGRALQGSGAIGSTVLALLADLTPDEHRTPAMALMGMTIGLSFMIAMIAGPLLNTTVHLSGIFWITALLAGLGMVILYIAVPSPPRLLVDASVESVPSRLLSVLKNKNLMRLDISIFIQHALLTALFLALPSVLTHRYDFTPHQQTLLYVIILLLAFVVMVPFIWLAEKKRLMKNVLIGAVGTIFFVQLVLSFFHDPSKEIFSIGLVLFFSAFTLLEALLPSLVSKISPLLNKGTAMGIYSTAQFLGIFCGGAIGGLALAHWDIAGIFYLCAGLAGLWLGMVFTMPEPPYLSTLLLPYDSNSDTQRILGMLKKMDGVKEVALMAQDHFLLLKIDKNQCNEKQLRNGIEQCRLNQFQA
ncbi:MAG TPA: MFS transporter [Coxiellaceae bacterium]|nr:MFS transporter [Coxiellaceae bacterium]